MTVARAFLACLLGILLAGCAGATRVASDSAGSRSAGPAVSEKSRPLREPDSPYRTVVPGDTLYSIAWESGQDYREVATWNRISPPYTIKPGQQIRVKAPDQAVTGKTARKEQKPDREQSKAQKPIAQRTAPKVASPAAKSQMTARSEPRSGAQQNNTGVSNSARTARTTTARTGSRQAAEPVTSSRGWVWPADGQVLNRYSESDLKGLDIAGARGTPVRASAAGRVVYQGSGLRGYGQLIIVKHSDEYLSAYAHNDRIYVKEGDVVKRGQKIADMGSTGTDRTKLHFEIRRQGVPVDPLKYLPRR